MSSQLDCAIIAVSLLLIVMLTNGCLQAGTAPENQSGNATLPDDQQPADPTASGDGQVRAIPDGNLSGDALIVYADGKGHPIPAYVYGQFIEHTGRCIYGGIWAEMIEDRKFLFPIGFRNGTVGSPWRMEGTEGVSMSGVDPFVGKHSPQLSLGPDRPAGIYQSDLGLVEDKDYEGYIIMEGDGVEKVEMSLVWGKGISERQTITLGNVSADWARSDFSFTSGAGTDNATLEITGYGEGTLRIGAVSLMPSDNIKGMRADVIALLKELDAPVYRWPGGLFANGYDWRKGIGDRDRRAPELSYAYFEPEYESHDFGTDEFMAFIDELGSEPYLAVSAMDESEASLAVGWLEYMNGDASTPMGRLRADNGHPAPYNVTFWGVGNENWALVSEVEDYIPTHNAIAKAMKKEDPSIQIIAVGGEGTLSHGWSEKMLINASENMDLISEHLYAGIPLTNVSDHVRSMVRSMEIAVGPHRYYRENLPELKGKDIKIALDEWNYARDETIQAQDYGKRAPSYYHEDALGYAAGLHYIIRNSDLIYMANTHPVNVNGGIKTSKTDASFETTGLVMKLYGNHFGNMLINDVSKAPGNLDVVAAWKGENMTIAIMNPDNRSYELPLYIHETSFGSGRMWRIASDNPSAYNEPGKPPQVVIEELELNTTERLSIAPYSVNIFELAP